MKPRVVVVFDRGGPVKQPAQSAPGTAQSASQPGQRTAARLALVFGINGPLITGVHSDGLVHLTFQQRYNFALGLSCPSVRPEQPLSDPLQLAQRPATGLAIVLAVDSLSERGLQATGQTRC